MGSLPGELRQVCRQLSKSPGFALVVICMMAGGIGVSTAIFSIVRNVLLQPLPFQDPGSLVQVISMSRKTGSLTGGLLSAMPTTGRRWCQCFAMWRCMAMPCST